VTGRPVAATADCEAIHDGWLAQPANALSSIAYLTAGAALAVRARELPAAPSARLTTFAEAVALNAIGALGFHGTGGRAGRWVHDAALLATLGLMLVTDAEQLASASDARLRPPTSSARSRRAAAVGVGSGLLAAIPAVSATAQSTAATLLAAVETALFTKRRRDGAPDLRARFGLLAAITGVGAAVHATSRTGRPLCRPASPLQGHAVWHVLSALALWWWADHALDGNAPRAHGEAEAAR
jgi:hypothetical protein